jgi:isoquinoline 1-oxidoreductase subunit beta
LHRVIPIQLRQLGCGCLWRGRSIIPWYFGAAMWQDIVITNGKITQHNFDTYRMPTMRDFPKEFGVHLVNTDKWNYGVGDEVTMVAPALCNAIFAATGKRIRSLPIQKHDLTWA